MSVTNEVFGPESTDWRTPTQEPQLDRSDLIRELGNASREAPKLHRERAVARARAAVGNAVEAATDAREWLLAYGADRFLVERAEAAMESLAVAERLLDPDGGA